MERSVEGYRRKWGPPNNETCLTDNPLTAAERDVLRRRLNGASTDKAIADERGCSPFTVKVTLANIKVKLRESGLVIRRTSDAVAISASNGWLEETPPTTG